VDAAQAGNLKLFENVIRSRAIPLAAGPSFADLRAENIPMRTYAF